MKIPKISNTVIYIIIIILVLVVVAYFIFKEAKNGDKKNGNGKNGKEEVEEIEKEIKTETNEEKRQNLLKEFTREFFRELKKPSLGTVSPVLNAYLKAVNNLSDKDLIFVDKEFNAISVNSLYSTIDNKWLPFSGRDEELLNRLEKLGLK